MLVIYITLLDKPVEPAINGSAHTYSFFVAKLYPTTKHFASLLTVCAVFGFLSLFYQLHIEMVPLKYSVLSSLTGSLWLYPHIFQQVDHFPTVPHREANCYSTAFFSLYVHLVDV